MNLFADLFLEETKEDQGPTSTKSLKSKAIPVDSSFDLQRNELSKKIIKVLKETWPKEKALIQEIKLKILNLIDVDNVRECLSSELFCELNVLALGIENFDLLLEKTKQDSDILGYFVNLYHEQIGALGKEIMELIIKSSQVEIICYNIKFLDCFVIKEIGKENWKRIVKSSNVGDILWAIRRFYNEQVTALGEKNMKKIIESPNVDEISVAISNLSYLKLKDLGEENLEKIIESPNVTKICEAINKFDTLDIEALVEQGNMGIIIESSNVTEICEFISEFYYLLIKDLGKENMKLIIESPNVAKICKEVAKLSKEDFTKNSSLGKTKVYEIIAKYHF